MDKELIVFDLDNTITNTLKYWNRILNKETFVKYGLKPNNEMVEKRNGKSNLDATKIFLELSKLKVSEKEILDFWKDRAIYYYLNKAKLIKGVKEFLTYLKASGYKLAVATATTLEATIVCLKKFNLINLFDFILTEEDLNFAKADEEFWQNLCKITNINKENIFLFEDSYVSVKCASNFGIECCGILHKLNRNKHRKMKECCKMVIKNYKDKKLIKTFTKN